LQLPENPKKHRFGSRRLQPARQINKDSKIRNLKVATAINPNFAKDSNFLKQSLQVLSKGLYILRNNSQVILNFYFCHIFKKILKKYYLKGPLQIMVYLRFLDAATFRLLIFLAFLEKNLQKLSEGGLEREGIAG
jgi:hypothetical protein